MADIFVSYKKEDAGRVVRIVEGLREAGFSVWWDHGIAPGAQWDQTIQKELNDAKMVVAVWSELSISAPWVKEEAGVGKARGKLLPVRIDDVEPPLGFGLIQMAGLIDWDGDLDDPRWEHFLAAVKATLSGEPVKGLERPVKRKSGFTKMLPILALFTLVAGVGVFVFLKLDSIMGISVDYDDGTSSEYARNGSPKPTDAENSLFEKAQTSSLKADYLDYLKIYPQGAFANKIREEVLPFCSYEQREKWTWSGTQQMMRGVSEQQQIGSDLIKFETEDQACEAAKEDVTLRSDQTCDLLASRVQARDHKMELAWQDCDCKFIVDSWFCSVDPTYSCSWEVNTPENIEVCK
ncbi:toll/interleukin-1 receptor domain-containing protein [Hirschia maritima]|uniref:toll/interleukin-1 receptor domain-containing protein n=1 Tax=Hirschia maritima TaxID=1121961 RepID=UPI00037765B1|nr:toll/interleukin-1 receptor domain-containing protein [Hirschia maritima]